MELTLLFDMLEALDCAKIPPTLQPLRNHIDDIGVPFKQAPAIDAALRAVVPPDAGDFLVLAWHHAQLLYQSGARPKRYHPRARDCCLACAEALLDDAFDSLKALVFEKLDSIVRASSLVEMVHSLIRPSRNNGQGQITQETFNLIRLYQNHRPYKSGKRQGQAPIELVTGKPLEAPWWERLRQQLNTEQGVTDPGARPSATQRHRVGNNHVHAAQQMIPPDQTHLEQTGASENDRRQAVLQAA